MPSRFQNNTREWVYLYLAARDGNHCLICGGKPSEKRKLEIDHADSNPSNRQPQNLHLLCRKCNLDMRLKSAREHERIISTRCAKNVCASVREYANTAESKQLLDYEFGSSEMKASQYLESLYREWITDQLSRVGFIPKKEAINSGAEFVGCSPITIMRYLDKLTSFQGVPRGSEKSESNHNNAEIIKRDVKGVKKEKMICCINCIHSEELCPICGFTCCTVPEKRGNKVHMLPYYLRECQFYKKKDVLVFDPAIHPTFTDNAGRFFIVWHNSPPCTRANIPNKASVSIKKNKNKK